MNDYQFKLVKIQGEFTWYDHSNTDEVFIVIEGSMEIELGCQKNYLSAGEMFVVPKGVEHKLNVENECKSWLWNLKVLLMRVRLADNLRLLMIFRFKNT